MSNQAEKLSAATVAEKLKAATKAHGGIHHHARKLAAQHYQAVVEAEKGAK
jgi:hypothetical protein